MNKNVSVNISDNFRPAIIGEFGPPILACIRSWGKQSWQPCIVSVQGDKEFIPKSKYLHSWTPLSKNKLFTDEGLKIISKFLEKEKISGITCLQEKIALWLHRERHKLPVSVSLWLPSEKSIIRALSKTEQIVCAKQAGFQVLPTIMVNGPIHEFVDMDFPLCIRPVNPGSTDPQFKVKIIYTSKEFETFLAGIKYFDQGIICQPFMNLPNLVVHGASSMKGEILFLEGFIVEHKFEGVSLTVRNIELNSELKNKCTAYVRLMDIVGPFHFEFLYKQDTDQVWFLEINTRIGGTTAKVYALGCDEPLYALKSFGISAKNSSSTTIRIASSRQALMKYLFFAITCKLNALDYPKKNIFYSTIFVLKGLFLFKDDIFTIEDLRGSSCLYYNNFRRLFIQ